MSKFDEMYNELYKKHNKQLEKARIKIILTHILFIIAMVILVKETPTLFFNTLVEDANLTISLIIILYCVVIGTYILLKNRYKKKYIKLYKYNIIGSIAKLVNENLEYKMMNTNDFDIKNNYLAAKFDNKKTDILYVDDSIEGTLSKDVHVKICDISIQSETELYEYDTYIMYKNKVMPYKKNAISKKKKQLQGIFAMATTSNDIETTIKISRNKLKILDSKERIQMDSSEFEKYFDVYAEDKIMAMRILTSDVMECLTDFLYKYDLVFEIVFKDNMIYLRFFTGPMFEPKIIIEAMDEWTIFRYYTILKFIIELTNAVNSAKKDLDI